MVPKREQCQFYIFAWQKLGNAPTNFFQNLQVVNGAKCLSYRTVQGCVECFRGGDEELKNTYHPLHPKTCWNEQTTLHLKKLIKAGLQIFIAELSDTCGRPYGTVERILSADLQLKKIALRWIPFLLKEKQINRRVKCSS